MCVFMFMYSLLLQSELSCRTYYKAVRARGGGGIVEDMYYERLRAEACVD